ncbi:MAG: uroporphyrinogen decarboxylase family protein [Anaerolineae bacterium]|nr:uroporphyrinogen decarboxylase family protein [Anaerolineae bacterium]
MRLIDFARVGSGHPVVPLMGFPGIQLTQSTIRQNLFNDELQARTIEALVARFRPDAAFVMMDLSVEAEAIGLPVSYPLNESPTVSEHPVRSQSDLAQFHVLDPRFCARVHTFEAVTRRLAASLDVPLGAYVVGPFSFAGLMMGATEIAMATVDDPDLVHAAATYATEVITPYALALAEAGAQMICILEPTATFISPRAFKRFSGVYVQQIVAALAASEADPMTILHVCGKTKHLVPAMCDTGVQGLSLDAPMDMVGTIRKMPGDVVLVGNIDPVAVMVRSTPQQVRATTQALGRAMAPYPNFVMSTGCDLPPETPLANIEAFMMAAREV